MSSLSLTLVICTKDREPILRRTLATVFAQTRLPDHIVLVDDGQMDGASLCRLIEQRGIPCAWVRKRTPGLAASRNLGIRYAPGDVILFLDDDVLLESEYLTGLLALFETEGAANVGGATGALKQEYAGGVKPFLRFFLLDGGAPGAVLASGAGVLVRQGEIRAPMAVEWLSGCNMAYRRSVFDTFRFDEDLARYGWGEDKDFSYRVGRQWRLMATPHARLTHLKEASGRIDERRFGFMETNYFWRFFSRNMPKRPRNWLAFGWALIGVLVRNVLLLAQRTRRKAALQRLGGNLRGIAAICTGKDYVP